MEEGTFMSTRVRQVLNVVVLVGVVIFNYAAQEFELGGNTNAELANRYDIYYFPANWAFSIWGIIYFFLFAWGIYQALPSQRDNPNLERIGPLFIVASLFNAGWLLAFHYEQFVLSAGAMIALLITLIVLYLRVGIGRTAVSVRDKWLVHVPFSLYLGWVTAATVTNVTYVLYHLGYQESLLGISAEAWAVVMLAVTAVIAIAVLATRRDIAYALVIVWALSAIASRYAEIDVINYSALAAAAVVVLAIVGSIFFNGGGRQLVGTSQPAGQRA
jgi:hypothetical protein